MGWLSGWTYRKSVTLSRATGAVTDYQMKLLVGESSGATGADVYCAGHCKTDFSDLRFTTSDGETLLDYWIESISGTTPNQLATVWIEFDSIGTSATTFYMYYGNASASAYSDGEETFPFFDDFDDGSIDTNKWYLSASGVTESGGKLSLVKSDGVNAFAFVDTVFSINYALRTMVKPTHLGGSTYIEAVHWMLRGGSWENESTYFCHTTSENSQKHLNWDGGTGTIRGDLTGASAGSFCIVDICRDSTTSVKFLINNSNLVTLSSYVSTANLSPALAVDGGNGASIEADWFLVRKYYSTEPTWGTWGSEEAAQVDNPILINASTYIAAGAADPTTARLTPPDGKTTASFQAGKISDDTNPLPSIDLAADKYTELEWAFKLDDALASGAEIELRVTAAGAALNNYEAIPKITIGTAPTGSALAMMLQMDHFNGGAL